MKTDGLKLHLARALFRWNLSLGIIGVIFTALTFVGVFAVLFALSWYVLLVIVLVVVFGTGLFLDFVKFWAAQATVGTVRNQYLVDTLYQKEALSTKYNQIPQLKTFRLLVEVMPPSDRRDQMLAELDTSILKLEETLRNKRWTIEDDERVY